MNKTLVAIGGGNWQEKGTIHIDQKIIALSEKANPKVLFFPTALHDDQGYAKRFKQYYRSLGCVVDAIRLFHTKKCREQLEKEWESYDIFYLGGGDSELLMCTLKEKKIDVILKSLYEKGKILVGYSAGANALFTYGYAQSEAGYQFVEGMDLVAGVFSPHVQERVEFFELAKQYDLKVIGCNDSQAYVIESEDKEEYYL